MNLNNNSTDGILDIVLNHIDQATSVQDVNKLLQAIPLKAIKSFLQMHVVRLANRMNESANINNEMRKLAISISPINDILPNDIMKHILSFIIFRNSHIHFDRKTLKCYQFLPVLCKSFRSIMNDDKAKYPLYVYDNPIDKSNILEAIKKVTNSTYDASVIHIYAEHELFDTVPKLKAMHFKQSIFLQPMQFTSTKTIKRHRMLCPPNIFQSSLPWKNAHKMTIIKEKNAPLLKNNVNVNIINLLNEMKHLKYLEIQRKIPAWRVNMYPTFQHVVCLSLTSPVFSGDLSNFKWLNKTKFPSLKILSIQCQNIKPEKLNYVMNSLNLSALEVCERTTSAVDCVRPLKISSDLEFLSLKNYNIKQLDLTKCDKLIGLTLKKSVSYSKIKWNAKHSLVFVNVKHKHNRNTRTYNWIDNNNVDWFVAYNQQKIPAHILIGHLFFESKAKIKDITASREAYVKDYNYTPRKYFRRRSMKFDEIVKFSNDSNLKKQREWEILYEQCFKVNEAQFIYQMPINYVPRQLTTSKKEKCNFNE
eukprot:107056_1